MFRTTVAALLLFAATTFAYRQQQSTTGITIVAEQPDRFDESACVVVSWSGADGDTSDDWVSSWWEPYKATYIQFFSVMQVPSNRTCFTLLNARHRYFFRYYRGGQVLAESNFVEPNGAFPMHVRVFLPSVAGSGGATDDLRVGAPGAGSSEDLDVSWISNRTLGGNVNVVRYGLSPDALNFVASSVSTTLTHEELNALVGPTFIPVMNDTFPDLALRALRCGTSAPTNAPCFTDQTACQQWVNPGWKHTARLTGLKPGTVYYYQIGEVGFPSTWTPVTYLRTRKTPDQPVSLLMLADGGFGAATHSWAGGAIDNKHKPNGLDQVFYAITQQYNWTDRGVVNDDLVVFNGDLSYAQGWPYAWERFHELTSPVFKHMPIISGYGNHEVDWSNNPFDDFEVRGSDSGGECGLVAKWRFSITNPWYIADYGPVTVITLSSEHNISQQVAFLERVLPTVNRSVTPWLVVQIHRPMYTSCFVELLSLSIRSAYREMFVQYNVDLVYTGHVHFYERTCPISNDVCADYDFRDLWQPIGALSQPENTTDSQCLLKRIPAVLDIQSCRAHCAAAYNPANDSGCRAIVHSDFDFTCVLLSCVTELQPSWDHVAFQMTPGPGKAPVYVIDGVAGAEPEPSWTFHSPLTRYKDFVEWGYSRLVANRTHMEFKHYHIDGAVHDHVVFEK